MSFDADTRIDEGQDFHGPASFPGGNSWVCAVQWVPGGAGTQHYVGTVFLSFAAWWHPRARCPRIFASTGRGATWQSSLECRSCVALSFCIMVSFGIRCIFVLMYEFQWQLSTWQCPHMSDDWSLPSTVSRSLSCSL